MRSTTLYGQTGLSWSDMLCKLTTNFPCPFRCCTQIHRRHNQYSWSGSRWDSLWGRRRMKTYDDRAAAEEYYTDALSDKQVFTTSQLLHYPYARTPTTEKAFHFGRKRQLIVCKMDKNWVQALIHASVELCAWQLLNEKSDLTWSRDFVVDEEMQGDALNAQKARKKADEWSIQERMCTFQLSSRYVDFIWAPKAGLLPDTACKAPPPHAIDPAMAPGSQLCGPQNSNFTWLWSYLR